MTIAARWCASLALIVTSGCVAADSGFAFPDGGMPSSSSRDGGIAARSDLGGHAQTDGATTYGNTPDLTMPTTITSGPVGPQGGSVGLLHFGISGDTRPPSCEDTAGYPTAIIDAIGDAMKQKAVQFSLDLGDHMYVCNGDLSVATAQMDLFMEGTRHYGGTWFMTEGNHECYGGGCHAGSTNANYVAFMNALAPISSTPYYSFDVQTTLGLATFVVVADSSWDSTQQSWLEQTLTAADQNATYTIVARHHPEGDTSIATNPEIMTVIRNHKFALFLAGHTHSYNHMTTDGGRDVVMGNGGAPLVTGGTFNGYGIIDQQQDGKLQVTVYDVVSGAVMDGFTVGPNA